MEASNTVAALIEKAAIPTLTAASPVLGTLQANVAAIKTATAAANNVIPANLAPEVAVLIGVLKIVRTFVGTELVEVVNAMIADLDILSGLPISL